MIGEEGPRGRAACSRFRTCVVGRRPRGTLQQLKFHLAPQTNSRVRHPAVRSPPRPTPHPQLPLPPGLIDDITLGDTSLLDAQHLDPHLVEKHFTLGDRPIRVAGMKVKGRTRGLGPAGARGRFKRVHGGVAALCWAYSMRARCGMWPSPIATCQGPAAPLVPASSP